MSRRKILEWSDILVSGDYSIDAQTRNFLRYTNEFIEGMDSIEGVEKLEKLLSFLTDYSREHFTLQQSIMDRTNYPSQDLHEQEHTMFIRNVGKLFRMLMNCKKYIQAEDPDYDPRGFEGVITDTYDFLLMWYSDHLCSSDRKFADYVRYEHIDKSKMF